MRRFRRKQPALARAAEIRRTDERRRLEVRARAYVATYLKRGRIIPPPACDACGIMSDRLRPWHPNPKHKRLVVWLCAPCHRHEHAMT